MTCRSIVMLFALSACSPCGGPLPHKDDAAVLPPADAASMSDAVADAADATWSLVGTSEDVTWTCVAAPCPWGASLHNQAVVWPAAVNPTDVRLGYDASKAVYLAAGRAEGLRIELFSGNAQVLVGTPSQPDKFAAIAALSVASGPFFVPSLIDDRFVVSIESTGDAFSFRIASQTGGTQ